MMAATFLSWSSRDRTRGTIFIWSIPKSISTNSRATSRCGSVKATALWIISFARAKRFSFPPMCRIHPNAPGHDWRGGGTPATTRRKGTRHFLLRKLRRARGRHPFRLQRYRAAFQPGHARFLERRCPSHLQKMRRQSRKTAACKVALELTAGGRVTVETAPSAPVALVRHFLLD